MRLTLQTKVLAGFAGVFFLGLLVSYWYAQQAIVSHLLHYLQLKEILPPGTLGDPAQVAAEMRLHERELLREMRLALLQGAGIALVVVLGLGLWLARSITGPVQVLRQGALRLAGRDYAHRVALRRSDEIGDLAAAVNVLAANLEQADRLRRDLVADVAHELRTPIAGIRNYVEALEDGVLAPDRETLAALVAEVDRLSRLIEDLHDLASLEADTLALRRERVDIVALTRQVLAVREPEFRARGLDLQAKVDDAVPPVTGDPHRLGQVIGNLLANAARYTPAGETVTISVGPAGGNVLIEVTNGGPGIAKEDLPFVFERFFRADRSRSRATGGSGLGLTISKRIIEAHGGTISADSVPGRTTFSVVLPVARKGPVVAKT